MNIDKYPFRVYSPSKPSHKLFQPINSIRKCDSLQIPKSFKDISEIKNPFKVWNKPFDEGLLILRFGEKCRLIYPLSKHVLFLMYPKIVSEFATCHI